MSAPNLFIHTQISSLSAYFESGLRPEMKMGPTILDTEDLVWHENMAQPELAVELGPAGSKDEWHETVVGPVPKAETGLSRREENKWPHG